MTKKVTPDKIRCHWVPTGHLLYERYHDTEWGVPTKNDRRFFEFLILESAQAGLSWETILKRREGYRDAFAHFDAKKIARFGSREVTRLMKNEAIIRNRLKILAAIDNAKVFLTIQKEFGSFSNYVRHFSDRPQKRSRPRVTSPAATRLAADLKRRGFKFFGPVIAYAFMQATGLVDDHEPQCFRYQ